MSTMCCQKLYFIYNINFEAMRPRSYVLVSIRNVSCLAVISTNNLINKCSKALYNSNRLITVFHRHIEYKIYNSTS